MIVLALTTSTPIASVAVTEGDRVLAEIAHGDPRGHAERLFDLVDRALVASGRARAGIGLVACDVGPGSFTGVRIADVDPEPLPVKLRIKVRVADRVALSIRLEEIVPDIDLEAVAERLRKSVSEKLDVLFTVRVGDPEPLPVKLRIKVRVADRVALAI